VPQFSFHGGKCLFYFLAKDPAMILQDILHKKGTTVHTIRPQATLDELVRTLVERNCGSLVVTQSDSSAPMLGIITERDVLRACAEHPGRFGQVSVADVMSIDVTIGSPSDSVEDTMGVMTEQRIRHMPVIERGRLVGIVSIGDIVKAHHDNLTMENHYLKTYIAGEDDSVTAATAVKAKAR
jgi:CBS domain-containing protein